MSGITFPKLVKIRQNFPRPRVEDVHAAVTAQRIQAASPTRHDALICSLTE